MIVGETTIEEVTAVVLHEYDMPPDAVSVALCPEQMAFIPEILAVTELIFTVNVAAFTQLFALVTVTVYPVCAVGLTKTLSLDEEVFQTYVPPPVATSVSELPRQMVLFPEIATTGSGFTTTSTESNAVPQEFVTATVYVVVDVGVATGFEIAGLLTVPTGVHAYVPFPLPFSVVFPPAQIVASLPALAMA